jgi:ribulose-5-phosphate 4-epimerase/fuculose-1-phosphate aldolase
MTNFSQDSYALRRDLAYGCRILGTNGHNDTVLGHVSYREPGADTYWMKPAEMGLDEVTPETFIRLDLDGNVVEGKLPRHIEFPIHSEILRAHPEITCVVHTHPIYSIAFAALDQPLRALSHEGGQLSPPDVPRFTLTSNLIRSRELGEKLEECIGNRPACLLQGHGIVTSGTTIQGAILTAINLERACNIQLLASACGPITWSSDEDALAKQIEMTAAKAQLNVWNYYCRKINAAMNASF